MAPVMVITADMDTAIRSGRTTMIAAIIAAVITITQATTATEPSREETFAPQASHTETSAIPKVGLVGAEVDVAAAHPFLPVPHTVVAAAVEAAAVTANCSSGLTTIVEDFDLLHRNEASADHLFQNRQKSVDSGFTIDHFNHEGQVPWKGLGSSRCEVGSSFRNPWVRAERLHHRCAARAP